jgi:hypothetical protein
MSRRFWGWQSLGLHAALLSAISCTPVPTHPQIDGLESGFSGRLARAHLRSIGEKYPRYPGSNQDSITRSYLVREFRHVGAVVRELVDGGRRHLVAEFEGKSDDVVLLVAAYSNLHSSDWVDDSGAAILLELARVFGSRPQPYTLRFALAETWPAEIAPRDESGGSESKWAPVLTVQDSRMRLTEAGRSLARGIETAGSPDRVRAVLVFDTSARGRRRMGRDLGSHPEFRRVFWQSASALGFESTFPPDAGWSSSESLQIGFHERSMDRVLALVHQDADSDRGTSILPAGEASPGMFESVGAVSVEGLSRLMRRFEKVDAFSQ